MTEAVPQHLSPPPRSIPAILTIRVVLGGVLSQIGWFFALIGLVFVAIFDPGPALVTALRFRGDVVTSEGVVVGWDGSAWSVNDQPVYSTRYDYADAGGRRLTGTSYATGRYLEAGERATVEYTARNPSLSRIAGMRTTPVGVGIAFVLIFPFAGMIVAAAGTWKGLRARRLMSTGRLALGTLKSKEPTRSRVNERTVYRLTFEFPAEGGGMYEVVGHTHRPEELEDEPLERVVYDPRNPVDAALLDELPCRPHVDSRGDFTAKKGREPMLALLNLLSPGLSLIILLGFVLR